MAVLRVAEDLQCVWIRCKKEMFGLNSDVILGAVYMRPQSRDFSITQVKELFTDFSDELARASQVTPNVVVCGDFNAKIGILCEVTDAPVGALVACPALQLPQRCACLETNAAGKLLVHSTASLAISVAVLAWTSKNGRPSLDGSDRPKFTPLFDRTVHVPFKRCDFGKTAFISSSGSEGVCD